MRRKHEEQNRCQMGVKSGEDAGFVRGGALLFPGSLWQPANHRAVISLCADFLIDDSVSGPAPAFPGVYFRARGISLSVWAR